MAATADLAHAGDSVLEERLDLGAVGGDAILLVAGRRVHQQCHRALQLRCPVCLLLLRQPNLGVVHWLQICLQIQGKSQRQHRNWCECKFDRLVRLSVVTKPATFSSSWSFSALCLLSINLGGLRFSGQRSASCVSFLSFKFLALGN